ncbi:MAG: hypothetical protein ACYC96_02030 [Fimbriimonadaceae bacterium]
MALCAALVLLIRSAARSSLVDGQTLVAGDLALTPVAIEEDSEIGAEAASRGRSFYVVRVNLANRSHNGNCNFDPHLMLVKAADTGKAVRSARGQRALGTSGRVNLTPGLETQDVIAFEGPSGIRRMSIRLSLLGGPGALISSVLGSSASVELRVRQRVTGRQAQATPLRLPT